MEPTSGRGERTGSAEGGRSARPRSRPGRPRLAALAPVALLLLAADGMPSAEEVLRDLPPASVRELREEGFHVLDEEEGEGSSFVTALVVFERGRGDVLELLRAAERQTEYRPELESVETVEQLPDGRVDEQRMRVFFRDIVYRLRYREEPESGRLEWSLDPRFENDLRRIEGFWELHPYEEPSARTLGRFGSSVDVGPLLPGFIQKRLSRRTVLEYVENIRRWINSDGSWRP